MLTQMCKVKTLLQSEVYIMLLIVALVTYFTPLIMNNFRDKNTTRYPEGKNNYFPLRQAVQKNIIEEYRSPKPDIPTSCKELKKAFERNLIDNSSKWHENFKTPFDFKTQRLIIYNKAAKCGSTTVENMMYELAKLSKQYLQMWTTKIEHMTSRDEKPVAASFSKGTVSSQLPVVVVQTFHLWTLQSMVIPTLFTSK